MPFKGTPKQREIMELVCQASEPITGVELHSKLSYGATASRSAIHCSIKFLIKHGLLTKETAGREIKLTATPRGLALYGPKPPPEFPEDIKSLY